MNAADAVIPAGKGLSPELPLKSDARPESEEHLREMNMALAARVAELEAANRELEAFTSSVAHDLRKPLTVINAYCQEMLEIYGATLEIPCRRDIQEIYESSLRMNLLIDTLLKFSSLGRSDIHLESVDLSDLARAIVDEFRMREPARKARFVIADQVSVMADAQLIRIVLNNLIENAWKFTGKKEETVIEFGRMEAGESRACFVRDNGAGFDMADAKKLFVPFQRLSGANGISGHGIGLATVERIVSRHGGRVWAEGEPGKGATFYFAI
jgi:light-regulated signal transduction histidine kinase (bacteriophytochrome)